MEQGCTVGVQTLFCTMDASTQTTCLSTIFNYAQNVSDWIIAEAFRYGRDVEKFAACLIDCILLDVFMAKSLGTLASYVNECIKADEAYNWLEDTKNVNQFSSLSAQKTLEDLNYPVYKDCSVRMTELTKDWNYCYDCDTALSETNSLISSPDPLQVLEDDIIKCLQTLTDDEELFSETSLVSRPPLNQTPDSGFLSSEDGISMELKHTYQKNVLPRLNEEAEELTSFKWPDKSFSQKSPSFSRTTFYIETCNKKQDPIAERQKMLTTLLVKELKVCVENKRKEAEQEEDSDIWTPGQSSSDRESDIQSKSIKSSPVKLKNVMKMIDHGRSKLSYQEVVSDDCLYNKNSTLKEPTILSKSASATIAVIDKSAFKTVNPVSVTYNDKEIPEDAIIVDKRVSVKDGNVQTDTYYAVPTKEISKVKNIIKAPTYDGIGPMEDGVPIGLRTAIKKEHSSDWYKTMFKSLHKLDTPEGKKYAVDGYMSDPELTRKDRSKPVQNLKSSVLTNGTHPKSSDEMNRFSQYTFPAAKSSYKPYSHKPWIISDYEPGNSSISDVEAPYENKRHLPPLQSLKPKYVYNDGYDSDSTLVHKTGKVHKLDPQQQKLWYHEIQKGGDVPVHGLCKPAPLKPSEPVVGPAPVMPIDWDADYYYKVCSTARTETRPKKLSSIPLDKDQEKQKTHEDICLKLDEMLLSTHEANKRHLPNKSPVVNSQLALNGSSSPSTSPIQPFKVTVLYDFVAHTSRELPLRKGDIVTVQRQMDKNWYEGKYKDKIGIFPISYTEPASMKSSNKLTKKLISGQARVKFDFFAENRVELSMHKGDIVSLIREVDNNWYEGELNENKGIFPASYVEILSDQNEIIQASSPKLLNSPLRNGKNDDLFPMYRNSLPVTLPAETVTSDKNKYDTKSKFTAADYDSNKISPYKVLYAYKPQNDDELELQEGDVVYVVEICDDGWFVGTSMRTGLFGTFPGNYIEKI